MSAIGLLVGSLKEQTRVAMWGFPTSAVDTGCDFSDDIEILFQECFDDEGELFQKRVVDLQKFDVLFAILLEKVTFVKNKVIFGSIEEKYELVFIKDTMIDLDAFLFGLEEASEASTASPSCEGFL